MSSAQHGTPTPSPSSDGTGQLGVEGYVAPGYEQVRAAFVDNFERHGDVGAAVAVYHDGRRVVDLRGGVADKKTMTPYTADTLQLFFSTTKGVTALCANLLAQQGELDTDAPASEYWPEFAAAGKRDVPVSYLLSHQVGLPYIDRPLTLEDYLAWDPAVEALAAMEPVWEPGTAHGYHAVTNGFLAGELIRRAAGKTVGQMVADELSGPLGLDLWIGLPDAEQERVAPLTYSGLRRAAAEGDGSGGDGEGAGTGLSGQDFSSLIEQFLGPDALLLKALDSSPGVFTTRGVFNRPEVRAAEIPSANGVGTARSLAKLYAAVVGPVEADERGPGTDNPLLTAEQRTAATARHAVGPDRVLIVDTAFGLGYMLSGRYSPYGGRAAFGHSGAGGSVAFADPENGLGVAYVMNRMKQGLSADPRTQGLIREVYRAVGQEPEFV